MTEKRERNMRLINAANEIIINFHKYKMRLAEFIETQDDDECCGQSNTSFLSIKLNLLSFVKT